eukprot:CAMPEP_0202719170 /NCGR_PEP_ID=MMETSP1385-20130828/128716_1 /ASSEMBLY_ACC=CAM_ASM_000861 /TAXON_ID=933848 /ORGANISM="Elphidium margaritaceum" /LENGTH=41 /DNA_ID= /DNA_START= /DNA_END= /DNA_ORIENTATION=
MPKVLQHPSNAHSDDIDIDDVAQPSSLSPMPKVSAPRIQSS